MTGGDVPDLPDEPRRYQLDVSDAADLEADDIYLWMMAQSPERAHRWYTGLLEAYESLCVFPNRYVAIPDQKGVRRMLYGKYRVTYRIVEAERPEDEGIVRILHVYHGARHVQDTE